MWHIVPVDDTTDYIVLDGIEGLVESLKNTIAFKDYELSGDVKLGINILNINFDINVDFKLKLTDNGPEVMVKLGPIPVITGVNDDVPWIVGNATNLAGNPGENRILTFYIKDNMVYIHRSETIPTMLVANRIYEKKTFWKGKRMKTVKKSGVHGKDGRGKWLEEGNFRAVKLLCMIL